jgi:uncharacterized protein (UPF0548 family)
MLAIGLALLQLAPLGTTLRLTPPGERDIRAAIAQSAGVPHNYGNAGLTRGVDDPGARIEARPLPRLLPSRRIALSTELGSGRSVYDRAVRALRTLQMHDSSPSRGIATLGPAARGRSLAGAGLVTWARSAVGLYAFSTCRIVYDEQSGWPARWRRQSSMHAVVAYGTLSGHWIAGEEAMTVRMDPEGRVTFSLLSISRGSGAVGVFVFPIIGRMQHGFFAEQVRTMRRLAQPRVSH